MRELPKEVDAAWWSLYINIYFIRIIVKYNNREYRLYYIFNYYTQTYSLFFIIENIYYLIIWIINKLKSIYLYIILLLYNNRELKKERKILNIYY